MKSLKFFLGGIAVVAMIFASCEDEKTNPIAENGSATISGVAYADISELNDTNLVDDWNYEFVPEGTVLYATLNTEDLTLVPSGATYDDLIVETTVGANGAYTFTVPANRKTVDVSITGDDFTESFTDAGADTVIYQKIYTLDNVDLSNIHDGAIRVRNLYYE